MSEQKIASQPLWSDDKTPEDFDVLDTDYVIYNLHEDVLCLKEEVARLKALLIEASLCEQAERNAKWLAEWKRKPEYKGILKGYLKRVAEIAGR